MLFNSMAFAMFLPVVFVTYWMIPQKYKGALLLVASYYFYMSWNPKYVVLIFATTVVSYCAAITIERKVISSSRIMVVGASVFCLGILIIFKYMGFLSELLSTVAGLLAIQLHPVTLNLLLPVGISFYTFQTMSYVIDVYKGRVPAEHNFIVYATFISFFPQLVAGPIERSTNLIPQIKAEKRFDYELAIYGARQMLWGFFKKIAVADVVAVYVDNAYKELTRCTSFDLCIAIFFFTIQIYCDFSGYSDIAIGTAKLFGIRLMKNFNSPYFSTSIKEFWSRWHISLSTWFRDYVYIPLGGNRCSRCRTSINVMITFLTSGLWHGANWTFVFWGGMHGIAHVIENFMQQRIHVGEKQSFFVKVFSWVLIFGFCNIAWVFFRADSINDALYVIGSAFGFHSGINAYLHSNIGLSRMRLVFCLFTIMVVAGYDYLSIKQDVLQMVTSVNRIVVIGVEYCVLLIIVVAVLLGAGSNQFVYFQF